MVCNDCKHFVVIKDDTLVRNIKGICELCDSDKYFYYNFEIISKSGNYHPVCKKFESKIICDFKEEKDGKID